MNADLNKVKEILKELISGSISREDAANWALALRMAEDEKLLNYIPKEAEQLIWDSILFIEGIDLQTAPRVYLHSEDDIREFLKKI